MTHHTRTEPPIKTKVIRPTIVDRRLDRLERRRVVVPSVIVTPPVVRPVPTIVVAPAPPVVRVIPRPVQTVVVRAPLLRLPVGGVAVTAAAAATAVAVAPRPVSAGTRQDAVWDHNKSVMRLTLEPEKIRYTYEMPRSGLSSLGIDRGTLLFEGRNVGGVRYEGTAYTFSRQCGALAFAVVGEAAPEGSRLELKGDRPIRNERCEVTRHEEETLVFDLAPSRGTKADPAPLLPVEQAVTSGDVPLSAVMAGDGPAQQPTPVSQLADPVWMYNGSPLRVEVDNLTVRFFQQTARAGSEPEQAGAKPRPLFEGRNIADTTYAGSAYAFSAQCGEVPFRVQGKVSPDGGRLELTGQRPELDDRCGVTGHRAENLVFELR